MNFTLRKKLTKRLKRWFSNKGSSFNIQSSISEASRLLQGGWRNVTPGQSSSVVHHLQDLMQSFQRSGNSQETLLQRSLKSSNHEQLYMELQCTLYQYLLSSQWQMAWQYWEPNCSGKQPVSIIWSWWNCILRQFEAHKKALNISTNGDLTVRRLVVQPVLLTIPLLCDYNTCRRLNSFRKNLCLKDIKRGKAS